ncbi:MAG: homoserine dehydrogenase [Verrucomicrobiae bacterium]|nr:homoserine dehydrogenase [Verrucomicrobiae bacterium]
MTKIAICGYGIVGSGVGILCREQADTIARNRGLSLEVKYILDVRDFPGDPYSELVTSDWQKVFSDPEVEIVVETIGGTGVALEYTRAAMQHGKHVVTSNKELVATHGAELLQLAAENKVHYFFEAAVGGGIPLLVTLREALAANDVLEITGILNGTCNYILTHLGADGRDFATILADAQDRGYAERDPAADVDGLDTGRKLAILASMVSGEWVDPDLIHLDGIRDISVRDAQIAEILGCKLRLVARLRTRDSDENMKYELRVAPTLLPNDYPVATAKDVFNAVLIKAYPVDDIMLYGRGAGSLPTASAVLGDVIEAALNPWSTMAAQHWLPLRKDRVIPFGDCFVSALIRVKKVMEREEIIERLHDLGGIRFLDTPFADEYLIETRSEQLREGRLESGIQQLPEGSCLQILRKL